METSAKTAMNVNDIFLAIGKSKLRTTPLNMDAFDSVQVHA